MRNSILIICLFILISCEKNDSLDILPNKSVNVTLNLDLPQYVNLLTPTGWAYTNGGLNGIVIQNTGIGNPPYKAFDRACPNNVCQTPMSFDGSLKLKCSCDDSEYSILDGSPQTSGNNNYAREYRVTLVNSRTINITNF
jgi:hypothetical protein